MAWRVGALHPLLWLGVLQWGVAIAGFQMHSLMGRVAGIRQPRNASLMFFGGEQAF